MKPYEKKEERKATQEIVCFICNEKIMFSDEHIPIGMKYEIRCKKCGTFIMMKKLK